MAIPVQISKTCSCSCYQVCSSELHHRPVRVPDSALRSHSESTLYRTKCLKCSSIKNIYALVLRCDMMFLSNTPAIAVNMLRCSSNKHGDCVHLMTRSLYTKNISKLICGTMLLDICYQGNLDVSTDCFLVHKFKVHIKQVNKNPAE